MVNRVVPSDFAFINSSPHEGLIGRLVEVMWRIRPILADGGRLAYDVNDCLFDARASDGVVWRVKSLGTPFILLSRGGKAVESLEWPCRDSSLTPVRDAVGIDQMLLVAGKAPVSTRLPRRG